MAGLLSGLSKLGLDNLASMNIYEEENKEKQKQTASQPIKVEERELVYDKAYVCPVCGASFVAKVMKTGKARAIGKDADLRVKYDGIDAAKYDIILCTHCGYAALNKFFPHITNPQARLVRENISSKVKLPEYGREIYSYEEAIERYQLCLANTIVKKGKSSEKAYICLKCGWLLRGYQESLMEQKSDNQAKLEELKKMEDDYLQNAYAGFMAARQAETFPVCGMDEKTVDYLIAVLAIRFKKYDVASRMVSSIITSPTSNARMKDKARDLKEQILAELKKKQ